LTQAHEQQASIQVGQHKEKRQAKREKKNAKKHPEPLIKPIGNDTK
jgi:hypothetical protein